MKPLYSGHPWDVANWLLYKGGLILQCTFNREVLFGTLLGGCFREVTFLYRLRYGCYRQVSLYYPPATRGMIHRDQSILYIPLTTSKIERGCKLINPPHPEVIHGDSKRVHDLCVNVILKINQVHLLTDLEVNRYSLKLLHLKLLCTLILKLIYSISINVSKSV